MRKWAVIALLSIALAGVFAWLAQRGPRSVEECKKEHTKAFFGPVWTESVREAWGNLTKQPRDWKGSQERLRKRIARGERALIKAGYLERRTFIVSNSPAFYVVGRSVNAWNGTVSGPATADETNNFIVVKPGPQCPRPGEILGRAQSVGTNLVIVVAPKEEMAKWEKLVREADARHE